MFILAVDFGIPLLLLHWIISKAFGKSAANTFMFFLFMTCLVLFFCLTVGGALTFMTEPESYWKIIEADVDWNWFDRVMFYPGATMLHMLLAPFAFVIYAIRIIFVIVVLHMTVGFAVGLAPGVYILYNYVSSAISMHRMKDPRYGF